MARLSPDKLRSRLAYDYEVVRGLQSPILEWVRPFTSSMELARGRTATEAECQAGRATVYLVRYRFPMLAGPDTRLDSADAAFNLLAGSNYPFTGPSAQIVSRPAPWCLHVHGPTGTVCLGDGWNKARGKMLFGQLIVHVAHLLNFDEPDRGAGHDAFDRRTLDYWRRVLGSRPLNPGLDYPVLPAALTHGVEPAQTDFALVDEVDFSPAQEGADFSPVDDAPEFTPIADAGDFSPIELEPDLVESAAGEPDDFRPLGVVL